MTGPTTFADAHGPAHVRPSPEVLDVLERFKRGEPLNPGETATLHAALLKAEPPTCAEDAGPQDRVSPTSDLTTYTLPELLGGGGVRTVVIDGEPWFVATDFAALLGYRDAPNMVRMLDDDEVATHKVSSRSLNGHEQAREVSIVSESGLYTLIVKSQRPEAKPFRRWVTHEVLPVIARTGYYEDLHGRMGQTLSQATDRTVSLSLQAAAQQRRLDQVVESMQELGGAVAEMTQALHAMQITQARSVKSHARQISHAFRLAGLRQPDMTQKQAGADPDRPLSRHEREKALHLWRSGVPFDLISKRLNRSHRALEAWAASEREVMRSVIQRGLF